MTGNRVAVSRVVGVPAAVAWATLTDVRRHQRWVPLTRIEAPASLAVGDTFTGVSGPTAVGGGPGLADTMVVVRLDAPVPASGRVGAVTGVAELRKVGPVLLGTAEIRVRPLGASHCEVTWVEDVHLRGPRWRVWPVVTGAVLRVPLAVMGAVVLRRAAAEMTARP
ncbi:SRPBCC family protein [Cellulomonas bogoriensis]|uniref:Polyketide cyclase n=1 Tax=Cellulomonas bogoriensis 69B4 = DSM 16987 TaxID=1386082 RepID=A0A0A0C072_9CELL|nr:SRPBCC family protein [Cellulomonas bogoriensis]KGM13327.1 hypothetical protein N869_14810 [Cellulomonas bogoriensis 69B4 = DSM 16987]